MAKKILVTGGAGFIGAHLAKVLIDKGYEVVIVDDLNDFTYSAEIKFDRLAWLGFDRGRLRTQMYVNAERLKFYRIDVTDTPTMRALIIDGSYDAILHMSGYLSLGASQLSPLAFFKTNVRGFLNVADALREIPEKSRPPLLFASSAAIYGNTGNHGMVEDDKNLLHPSSVYGSTKAMMEDAAEIYANFYGVKSVALRLFNIYGPYCRPDTLATIVSKSIIQGDVIPVYNNAQIRHDFMYIDDCVRQILEIMENPAQDEPRFAVYNISNGVPTDIAYFIQVLEKISGKTAMVHLEPIPSGEIQNLIADTEKYLKAYHVKAEISIEEGLKRYFEWFKTYYAEKL